MSRLLALAACILCTGAGEAPAEGEAPAREAEVVRKHVAELVEEASSYLEEDRPKREAAKDTLVEIGAPAVAYLVSRLDTTDVMESLALFDVLPRIGEPAVDALHEAFLNPRSPLEHRRAISLIGAIGSARSRPVFIEAAHDGDWAVRASAAAGLSKLTKEDPQAREHLLALLSDEDRNVRLRAVLALGDAGVGEDLQAVAARLRDRHFSVRLAATEILGDQRRRAVAPIAEQLEARGATVVERLTCLQALGRTKHPAAAVYIEPLLIHPHPLVRTYAVEAYASTASASGAPLCTTLLDEEKDPNVRLALRQAFKAIEARAARAGGL